MCGCVSLIDQFPETKESFKYVDVANPDGPVFSAHSLRIFNSLDMLYNLLEHPQALDAALEHLADQHAARSGLRRIHFRVNNDIFIA